MVSTDYSHLRTRTLTLLPILKMFFDRPEDRAWLQSWARECGESPEKLTDPYAWISGRFYYGLLELIASRKTHDAEEFRTASLGIMSREYLGTLYTLARAFGSPESTYERYASYLNSLQEIGVYRIEVMSAGRAVVSFNPRQSLPCQDMDCAYRLGALEAIPLLWDLPPARIRNLKCLVTGDDRCEYEVSWVPLRRRRWSWLSAAAGGGLGALAWTVMASREWVAPTWEMALAFIVPWGALGYLAAVRHAVSRQLRDTSKVVGEQVGAIEKELVNTWRKYEEVNERARVEERIRRMFQKYVPPTVIEQALKEDVQTGGEAVEVAVLFADMVGFTSYAESTAPDVVMKTINEYMAAFSETIAKHDGTVDKFLGDGIMAVFGAPVPDPDGPSRAVRCALAMLGAAGDVNRRTGRNFQVRIGIHCGPAVAGNVGSPDRLSYTVIGDTVNVAARLQAEAKPGGILVSDEVKARAGGTAVFRSCTAIRVRGRTIETRVFELEG